MTTEIGNLHKEVYPTGFFITDDDEIIYSTGKAPEITTHVLTIRMLELEGPTEQYERFDTLSVASYVDARKFYDALCCYIDNKNEYYRNKVKDLQQMFLLWTRRLETMNTKEDNV